MTVGETSSECVLAEKGSTMPRWFHAFACLVILAVPSIAQAPAAAATSPLASISWMQGTWTTQAAPPGQAPVQIEQHISSVLGGQAMSFSTSFNGVQQYQGLFAYDPARKVIAFWYPSADGELTSGTVSRQEDYLLWDFQVTSSDGTATPFQVHIKQVGSDDYDWTIYSASGSDWKQMFSLHYHRKSS